MKRRTIASSVKVLSSLGILAVISGCATTTEKYDWGDYDPALYSYYKSPAKVGELTTSLQAAIGAADTHHQPAAPGLRAEYGYLLLQQGNASEAVKEFQLEEQQWPESRVFMDHMIKVASAAPQAAKGQ